MLNKMKNKIVILYVYDVKRHIIRLFVLLLLFCSVLFTFDLRCEYFP